MAQTCAAVSVMLIAGVLCIEPAGALTAIALLCVNDEVRCVLRDRPARAELPTGPANSAAVEMPETEQRGNAEP